MTVSGGATISARSLSPFGERVGVRGSQNYREALTPHPTPLPMGEGADRACRRLVIECHDSSHGESGSKLRTGGRRSRPATGRGRRGRSAVSGKQFFSARRILLAACVAAGLGAFIAPAAAQGYPNRPVKIIVPFVPGGPTEFIRLLADRLAAGISSAIVCPCLPTSKAIANWPA